MKTWNGLRNSWRRVPWKGRLSLLVALCLGALLLTLYLEVLRMGVARADQLRLGQQTTSKTHGMRTVGATR